MLGYVLFGQSVDMKKSKNTKSTEPINQVVIENDTIPKQFSNEEFKNLYSSFRYPNTEQIITPPEITGNVEADQIIRKVALSRGYRISALPVASIVKTGEPGLEGDDLMQPMALMAWQELKKQALSEKIPLKLTSAYRSIEYQRNLFLRKLKDSGVNVNTILGGYAEDELAQVLSQTAPPGYSRHHTGYTMDLSCNGIGLHSFIGTSCYAWLSKNNFENVKKHGWVPSYPEGVTNFGPEPEAWEYTWVGRQILYQ